MRKKIVVPVIICSSAIILGLCIFFIYLFLNNNHKKDQFSELLELKTLDTEIQHCHNMDEKYQLTDEHLLYLDSSNYKSDLYCVNRQDKSSKIIIKQVLSFIESDEKIYYLKSDYGGSVGGIYCYDTITGENRTIVSEELCVQWFTVYNSKIFLYYYDDDDENFAIGRCGVNGGKIKELMMYDADIPFKAILCDDAIVFFKLDAIDIVSWADTEVKTLLSMDSFVDYNIAYLDGQILISVEGYQIDANYNHVKLDKEWNGVWVFNYSEWKSKRNDYELSKIAEKPVNKMVIKDNKLYDQNDEKIEIK